jgi:signal transduction histidine kinase
MMRARVVSLLLRPTAPPVALGLVFAASLIVVESVVMHLLKQVYPGNAFGVVFLLGVLVVSTVWGFGLAAITSVASALAFDYYRNWRDDFIPTEAQNWVAIAIFLVVALLANTLADLARSRAVEADQRRREAEALAELQAALRRVATLVAQGVEPSEVISAVTTELARFLGVQYSALWHYQSDGTVTLLAACEDDPGVKTMPVGARFSLEGESISAKVWRTARAARMDSFEKAPGSAAARFRELGVRVAVGAPIVVRGRLWGAAVVGSSRPEPLPPDTEARVGNFADLVATAIANAQAYVELTASRARIVTAGDEARRRFERDLHDGAQQHLVTLALYARAAEAAAPSELAELKHQMSRIASGLAEVSLQLQEISRGIPPAILAKGGLLTAIEDLARRSPVPVQLDVAITDRLPEPIQIAAYYLVAEALTNTAKHAHACTVEVQLATDDTTDAGDPVLRVWVRDDGRGGADPNGGSGLVGLTDRVEALGGRLWLHSPPGAGTAVRAELPLRPAASPW